MNDVSTFYTNFYNGFAALEGTGNISVNPLFASATDFHLQSSAGRWNGVEWVFDQTNSPCIDAGDPESDYSNEPEPNGGRVNMGRYGNTAEASKSALSNISSNLLSEFGLGQNTPNPFNPDTVITYTVPEKIHLTLKIYSVNGQEIETLVDAIKGPGVYSLQWSPVGIASGMYFCRMEAGNFIETRKMLYMK